VLLIAEHREENSLAAFWSGLSQPQLATADILDRAGLKVPDKLEQADGVPASIEVVFVKPGAAESGQFHGVRGASLSLGADTV